MFRLALALGMPVGELLRRMSSRELTEWMAYYQLEPWDLLEDWRAGMIAATVANTARDPKKRRKPYEPQDFMPRRDAAPKEEQDWETQARILEMWGRVWEAKFGKGGS